MSTHRTVIKHKVGLLRLAQELANRVAGLQGHGLLEEAIVGLAFEQPAFGQVRVSNELRKQGHHISPAGVRGVWLRHGLQTFKHRLAALERKVAEECVMLTESWRWMSRDNQEDFTVRRLMVTFVLPHGAGVRRFSDRGRAANSTGRRAAGANPASPGRSTA